MSRAKTYSHEKKACLCCGKSYTRGWKPPNQWTAQRTCGPSCSGKMARAARTAKDAAAREAQARINTAAVLSKFFPGVVG